MPFSGKTVLITGAGMLGFELTKQLLKTNVRSVRLLDSSEHALFNAQNLQSKKLRLLLGDVRNLDRVELAMDGVDYVIHTVALKSVDIALQNPMEAVDVNIMGSFTIIKVAMRLRIKRVLCISSDKSIISTSDLGVYHVTKYILEEVVRWANFHSNLTRLACFRPPNFVSQSPGHINVFDTWYNQYTRKQPITLSHPSATRYFIPIQKAAAYTLKALQIMKGGEIFVPPASKQSIFKLARRLGRPIKITGLRAGDRLTEQLVSEAELKHARRMGGMLVV